MLYTVPDTQEIKRRIEDCRLNGREALDLSHLYMTELPPEIKNLGNLSSLNLSYNQLQSLPDWIGTLKSLKKMNVAPIIARTKTKRKKAP